MVTLTSASNALKNIYLDVVSNQLNTKINPFYAMMQKSSNFVNGNTIVKAAPIGLNGGIGAGTEDGALPAVGSQNYVQFRENLKNLYGRISISDKALRGSASDAGAFVNLLNAEMDSLIEASQFNFSRMLFGNGTGKLATVVSAEGTTVVVDNVTNLAVGQILDVFSDENVVIASNIRIIDIDRATKTIVISSAVEGLAENCYLTIQNSKDNEITGIEAIFDDNINTLYGVDKETNRWVKPFIKDLSTGLSEMTLQMAIDDLYENTGSEVNYITCSNAVRRAYVLYMTNYRKNIDVMNLEGGFKAVSYNGIPFVADRFIENNTLYLLNSNDFTLHQLCDWKWLEGENGNILKQNAGFATYTATLVKYANLMCDKPCGQGKIINISV